MALMFLAIELDRGQPFIMTKTPSIHIVDSEPARRAALARLVFHLGWHAEIYEGASELLQAIPKDGILFVHDSGDNSRIPGLVVRLAEAGRWCAIIGYCDFPKVGPVVAAVKGGALDFIVTPTDSDAIETAARGAAADIARRRDMWERAVQAHSTIARLSGRERQVLDALVSGHSNKSIARELDISPRTVEIHRMKMFAKLGARNSADAVRLHLQAGSYEPLAA